ncbi:hypothetical protein ACTXT7_002889 [Hymenolepis weldensis]
MIASRRTTQGRPYEFHSYIRNALCQFLNKYFNRHKNLVEHESEFFLQSLCQHGLYISAKNAVGYDEDVLNLLQLEVTGIQ